MKQICNLIKIASLYVVLMVSACSTSLWQSDAELANTIAEPAHLNIKTHKAGKFVVHSRERYDKPGQDLSIYLEGDGLAWISRTEASRDPTPDNPIGLRLAAIDPAPNVVWMARPCQYTTPAENPSCSRYYWTIGRLAPEIVDAVDQAITAAKKTAKASKIHLIGYSGGGGLALLIAARRSDVASIRTLAGNIDHEAFTSFHQVTPMSQSLDPASVAKRINTIPQWHFFGAKDKVVPEQIGESYRKKIGTSKCIQIKVIPNISHNKGWEILWPSLLKELNQEKNNKNCN